MASAILQHLSQPWHNAANPRSSSSCCISNKCGRSACFTVNATRRSVLKYTNMKGLRRCLANLSTIQVLQKKQCHAAMPLFGVCLVRLETCRCQTLVCPMGPMLKWCSGDSTPREHEVLIARSMNTALFTCTHMSTKGSSLSACYFVQHLVQQRKSWISLRECSSGPEHSHTWKDALET